MRVAADNVENILGDVCDYATEVKVFKKDPAFDGPRKFFAPYLELVPEIRTSG
jgi:hypothetical protein